MTSILGKACSGKRCVFSAIANTNRMAMSSRPTGSPTSLRVASAVAVCTTWPKVDGTLKMKASTMLRIVMDWGISATTTSAACSSSGCWTCLALTLERLYRLRYLHRGAHPVRAAINLYRLLLLTLSCRSSPIPV